MSAETETKQVSMSPGRLLRILFGRVKPYSPRAVVLVVTLPVEGVFNVLLALSLKLNVDYALSPRDARAMLLILVVLGIPGALL